MTTDAPLLRSDLVPMLEELFKRSFPGYARLAAPLEVSFGQVWQGQSSMTVMVTSNPGDGYIHAIVLDLGGRGRPEDLGTPILLSAHWFAGADLVDLIE